MKNRLFLDLFAAFLLVSVGFIAWAHDSEKMRQIFERSPYVVRVVVTKIENNAQQPSSGYSVGTGVLIKDEGQWYVLTNEHVVRNASRIWITFEGGMSEEVKVMGASRGMDAALLVAPLVPRGIYPVKWGDSDKLRHGEEVYALGHPFGTRAVTVGNITAIESGSWLYIISQTPLNPGSSGGPLFNKEHEMIALNTAIIQGANLVNFSIPINHIKRILPRLIKKGAVSHGSTGLEFENVRNLSPHLWADLGNQAPKDLNAIVIYKAELNSPAFQAGLRNGDVIVALNGVGFRSAKELAMKIFFDFEAGDEVVFTVRRGEQLMDKKIKLVE